MDIFYMILLDSSGPTAEIAMQSIESFSQKKTSLLIMNMRARIVQSFAFAYKINEGDLLPLLSLPCPYAKYFSLFGGRDRYSYIDPLIELLFETSEEIISPSLYGFIIWILLSLEYSSSEKNYLIGKLESHRDAIKTLVYEKLKQGKKEKRLFFQAISLARVDIMLATVKPLFKKVS